MRRARTYSAVVLILTATRFGGAAETSDDRMKSRDELRAAIQKICPMAGQELGTHGTPVKVKIGSEHVFLCCRGCLKKKVNPTHWATIHANFAKAQGKCPVMNQSLPKNPKWTIVRGKIVYVCCPPCIDKINADPEPYLRKLSTLYVASRQSRNERR